MNLRRLSLEAAPRAITFATCLLAACLLSGCSQLFNQFTPLPDPMAGHPTPRLVQVPPESGSLYSSSQPSHLLADLRAKDVGDIITVRIAESSRANRKASTNTQRSSTLEAGVENALGVAESFLANNSATLDGKNLLKGELASKFKGDGETSGESTMSASISMRVTEVLPNGNLIIAGSRRVKINNEDQVIVLSGVVRPSDISPDK